MDERSKSSGYNLFDEPFGTGGDRMLTVTVVRGLVIVKAPCNRNRKHPIPACPDNVDQHIVSD